MMKATEVTAGLAESNDSLLPDLWRDSLLSRHLRADCLYTGISSGPNARKRVWENFTFFKTLVRGSAESTPVPAITRRHWHLCLLRSSSDIITLKGPYTLYSRLHNRLYNRLDDTF